MAKRNSWSNQGRFEGLNGLTSMVLALILSVSSITVAAQTVFEFEDPLEQTRAKIESGTPTVDVAPAAAAEAETARAAARIGPTEDVKGPITVFAERLGLPTVGLVGLGVLALLALVLGLMWLLGRRNSARMSQRADRELYAVSDGARGRRTLESGAKVTRNRKKFLDTTEEDEITARPSAAAKAAQIISGGETSQHADDDDDAYMLAYDAGSETSARPAAPADPDNPDTWQRPNLDRLKDSIRKDWKEGKEEQADPEADELRKEAEVFADLFGEEETPPAAAPVKLQAAAAAKSPALDMLDTYEQQQDPMSVSALQAAVEKTADVQPSARNTASSAKPDRADALRRIKALRESVKAS